MDAEELNKTAKQAIELWSEEKFEEAEPYFEKVYPHIDREKWSATDLLSYFGLNQRKLGKTDQATQLFKESLEAALKIDAESSVTVTLARFTLGDHFYNLSRYDDALATIEPSLKIESEQRRILLFLFAQIQNALGNASLCRETAEELLPLMPSDSFSNVDDVLRRIRSNEVE